MDFVYIKQSSADPFFAHCRQHTDKSVACHRRRNYLTAYARLKKWRVNQNDKELKNQSFTAKVVSAGEKSSLKLEPRILRKLDNYRFLYENLRRNREKPYGKGYIFDEMCTLSLYFNYNNQNC